MDNPDNSRSDPASEKAVNENSGNPRHAEDSPAAGMLRETENTGKESAQSHGAMNSPRLTENNQPEEKKPSNVRSARGTRPNANHANRRQDDRKQGKHDKASSKVDNSKSKSWKRDKKFKEYTGNGQHGNSTPRHGGENRPNNMNEFKNGMTGSRHSQVMHVEAYRPDFTDMDDINSKRRNASPNFNSSSKSDYTRSGFKGETEFSNNNGNFSRQRMNSENSNLCTLCIGSMSVRALGDCDHPICYKCATRMRVLCDQKYCPICRRDLPKVVFVTNVAEFDSLQFRNWQFDKRYGIYFQNEQCWQNYLDLMQHKCHICKQRDAEKSLYSLQDHLRRHHELFFCELCVQHLKVFTEERKSYTRKDLAKHRRVGDEDDTSFKGHPLCEFCDNRFLDDEELYKHLRREHYFCHFCDADSQHQYFRDYGVLREHFRRRHFLCEEGACAEERFTSAFRTDVDLKAHRLSVHTRGAGAKKGQSKAGRTLELEFSFTRDRKKNDEYPYKNGVIGGDDYQEVKEYNKRGRGHEYLSENKYGTYPVKHDRKNKPRTPDTPNLNDNLDENFPRLNGATQENSEFLSLDSSEGAVGGSDTIANILSHQRGFNTGSRRLDEHEFPTLPARMQTAEMESPLSGSKVGLTFQYASSDQRQQQPTSPSVVTVNVNPSLLQNEEEFPRLGGGAVGGRRHSEVVNVHWETDSQPVMPQKGKSPPTKNKYKKKSANKITALPSKNQKEDERYQCFVEDDEMLPPGRNAAIATAAAVAAIANSKSQETTTPTPNKLFARSISVQLGSQSEDDFPGLPSAKSSYPPGFRPQTVPRSSSVLTSSSVRLKTSSPSNASVTSHVRSDAHLSLSPTTQHPTFESELDFPGLPSKQTSKPLAENKAPPPGFTEENKSFSRLSDYTARNQNLISRVKNLLGNDEGKFSEFKMTSGRFRQGNLTAHEYYSRCQNLFGIKGFSTIFPELLVLLPDIDKQQDLLLAHKQRCDKMGRHEYKKKFDTKSKSLHISVANSLLPAAEYMVCTYCTQVIAKKDKDKHFLLHS